MRVLRAGLLGGAVLASVAWWGLVLVMVNTSGVGGAIEWVLTLGGLIWRL
jgi:hypothetical protein